MIANRALLVEGTFRVIGTGSEGARGPAGRDWTWRPSGGDEDRKIHEACPNYGANQAACACDATTTGGAGGTGGAGARVALIVRRSQSERRPVATVDISGGPQGHPGSAAHKFCEWSRWQCSSPDCNGPDPRNPGPSGSLWMRFGGDNAHDLMDAIAAARTPSGASVDALVTDTAPSFENAVSTERAFATQNRYDQIDPQ